MRVVTENITTIASGNYYMEGPAIDSEGKLYCTTLLGGSILQISKDGTVSEWTRADCPNGQFIFLNDEHIVCEAKSKCIARFDAAGSFIQNEIENTCAGKKLTALNDLIADKAGNIFFTDSVRHTGMLCYKGKAGNEVVLSENLDYPNGLVLSHDEKTLFVAESYQNRIIQFDISHVQEGLRHTVFANLPNNASGQEIDNLPDGIALHKNGIMAVAHYGMGVVQLLAANGKWIGSVEIEMRCSSNVIFLNEKTLFVTGGSNEPGPGFAKIIELNFQ
ncbi:MAG: SMP-30/gluconolactonase/LRE family protein [Ginsengibacter sp.]